MPGMRDQFAHFYAPDDAAVEAAIKTGLVAPDANVLLNLYRFQTTARDELFGALEKLGDRLWIPHQVGLEFHQTRLSVIAEQEGYFAKTKDDLDKSLKVFGENVQAFKRRLSLDDDHVVEIKDALATLGDLVADAVARAGELNEVRLKDHSSDAVRDRIDGLFTNENSVGKPMEQEALEAARAEAERRGEERIPPGYRDKNKTKGDPAGDYIVWRQLMDEAKERKLPVVFITDDTKEDWYQREQGQTLGARRELRVEMMTEAGVPLLIMTTETFLRHAKKYLDATVSDETVEQANELPSAFLADSLATVFARRFALSDQSDVRALASLSGGELTDALLERVASGAMDSPLELIFTLVLLRDEVGPYMTMHQVINAVIAGQESGTLNREGASAVLEVLMRVVNGGQGAETFPNTANPSMPMLRDTFERALKISPGRDDPDKVANARRTLAMLLERDQATPDDRERARAWLRESDEWVNTQRAES